MGWLLVAGKLVGLLGRLGGAAVQLVWARRRAAHAFQRRLLRSGLPPEAVASLSRAYREGLSLSWREMIQPRDRAGAAETPREVSSPRR